MPGKKVPKVAYAVFVGRNPGVYSTWSEAQKEVDGFSRAEVKGYTSEEGGRRRAEGEYGERCRHTALMKENTDGHADKSEKGHRKPAIPEEPIRVYVSGDVAQYPSLPQRFAEQLQTPPNTLLGKKKERPHSWVVEQDLRKKVICVDHDSPLEGAVSSGPEHTFTPTTSHPALSSSPLFCNAGACARKDGTLASATAAGSHRSNITSDDTSFDDLTSSSNGSSSTGFRENSSNGDTAGKAEINGRVLVSENSDDHSGASTALFGDCGSEEYIGGKKICSQLPAHRIPGCTDADEGAPHDRGSVTNLSNATLDPFSPTINYIAFGTSSDYGEFVDKATVLEHVSADGPRTEPHLCDEQLALIELIMDGKNVFYTGSAGCGKSTVLKHFVTLLKREGKKVDILAPTGRAALAVNGRTLYNYAGWIPRSLAQPLGCLESKALGKKVWKRLKATDVLVIDEISMVSNHVFERLNCIMKSARGTQKPFGGVQLIVTGDFFQLPPVNAFEYCLMCGTVLKPVSWEDRIRCRKCLAQFDEIEKWAFKSAAWLECGFEHVNLEVIHRQNEAELKAFLERRRLGLPWRVEESRLLLKHKSDTRGAVRLFPRRADVRDFNEKEFAKLPGRALDYSCVDDFFWNREHDNLRDKQDRCLEPMNHALEALGEHCLEPKLMLKEGMPVVLLVNWDLESSLANGSQGKIVGFEKHDPKLLRTVPRDWEYSSRRNGLVRVFVNRTAAQEWPIVQFLNGERRTIYPRCMMHELGDDEPYSLLSRTQIPLTAGWALTVHKAQGMTLSRVIVDLSHSFEQGQEYVALSRAETLAGLKVESLPERERGPNKEVIEFYQEHNIMPAVDWDEFDDATSKDNG